METNQNGAQRVKFSAFFNFRPSDSYDLLIFFGAFAEKLKVGMVCALT
jgi:hypothetical protein